MARPTKPLENWLTRQLISSLVQAAQRMPDRAIHPMGAAIGGLAYAAMPRRRQVARANLREVYGASWSPARVEHTIWRCFHHLGQTLAEFARMAHWDGPAIVSRVEERGLERLEAALAAGRGAIIASAHYGNWELAAARIAHAGYPVHVVARDVDDAGANALLHRVRRAAGYGVISRQSAARGVISCLRRNEVVAILMDQCTKDKPVFVEFFGRPAATTPGPALLARRTGAALLPGFIRRCPDGTHVGEILPPVECQLTRDAREDVLETTQRLTHAIEAWIREEPEQWLWIHRRWKVPRSEALFPADADLQPAAALTSSPSPPGS